MNACAPTATTKPPTYSAAINPPGWYNRPGFGWLLWLARLTGASRKWEARGVGLDAFDREIRRVAASKGLIVSGGPVSGYTIMSLHNRDVFTLRGSTEP